MADRLALIIANSEFDDRRLTRLATPSRDAEALAEVLSDPDIGGFQLTRLVNEPLPVVRREVARLYHRRTRDDLLLLYYSGHGFKDDYGELYLAVRDTEHEILGATALDAVFVRRQLDQSNSQRKVVILDCCHSGAFVPGGKAILGSSVGTGEALAGSGYGRVILTASNAVEYAWEGERLLGEAGTSTFTHYLVHGLRTGEADRDQDGRISLDELYDYVYEQVVTSGLSRQTPQKWAQRVEGQITIAQNPRPVIKPAALPPQLQQAIESPFAGVREGAVRELGNLFQGSDKGLALAAQKALERLLDDDSRSVSAAAARVLGVSPQPLEDEPVRVPTTPVVAKQPETRAARVPRRRPISFLDRPIPWRWITAVGLVAVALILFVLVFTGGEREEGIGKIMTRERDGVVMVYVPGGTFQMGSAEGESDEEPVHSVTLDSFWIDKHEVTNAQFAAFLNEQGHQTEGGATWLDLQDEECLIEQVGREYRPKSGYENHPVIEVSWYGAAAYCKWAGARLPAEAEWEYAARGAEGNIYPWGNEFDCSRGNFDDETQVDEYVVPGGAGCDGYDRTAPVGSFEEGASWCEALDMAGNVWEWVNDWYQEDYYAVSPDSNPRGPETGDYRVLRGDSWYGNWGNVRSAERNWDNPDISWIGYGFRCVGGSTP